MKKIICLLLNAVFFFCVLPAVSFVQSSTNQPYPAQYGKPFKQVPDRRDVTLYQVNMRSFSKNGDLKAVTARLDSVQALGMNVIYLMPV